MMGRFTTTLGCTVIVSLAPQVLGEGVILTLDMEREDDPRYAEVFLTVTEMDVLKRFLQ